jgi:hypothetical protein
MVKVAAAAVPVSAKTSDAAPASNSERMIGSLACSGRG